MPMFDTEMQAQVSHIEQYGVAHLWATCHERSALISSTEHVSLFTRKAEKAYFPTVVPLHAIQNDWLTKGVTSSRVKVDPIKFRKPQYIKLLKKDITWAMGLDCFCDDMQAFEAIEGFHELDYPYAHISIPCEGIKILDQKKTSLGQQSQTQDAIFFRYDMHSVKSWLNRLSKPR